MAALAGYTASTKRDPAIAFAAITKSDTVDFTGGVARGIYVGGAGDVAVVGLDNTAVTFAGATAGSIIPVICRRINSTNTTATNMVALY